MVRVIAILAGDGDAGCGMQTGAATRQAISEDLHRA
jgi:hypothetical protein